MKGQNFASQVLSRHTFRISRKKGSDVFDHRGTLRLKHLISVTLLEEKPHFDRAFKCSRISKKQKFAGTFKYDF